MNMILRQLGMALYDIEAACYQKDDDELKRSINIAIKTYHDLRKDIATRNTSGFVELNDIYAFLEEIRDENVDEWNIALTGKDIAQKKWNYIEDIIDLMQAWFIPIR